jgi:ribosomal protein L27
MFQATNQMGMGQDLDLFLEKRGCTLFLKQKNTNIAASSIIFSILVPLGPQGRTFGTIPSG